MLSTYTSYNLIARDLLTSLNRVSQESINAREAAYYKENIGRVGSVDEFLDDYRLYSYAMKAYGLEEMTYAKAFMRKVLESDLTDENSFVNLLTDTRYRTFATAFSFEESTAVAQTDTQVDEIIGLYKATIDNTDAVIKEESRYYGIMIDNVTSVDGLLRNDRLRNYVFTVFGIDKNTYSYQNVRDTLTSDLDDPDSYVNKTYVPYIQSLEEKIAAAQQQLSGTGLSDADKAALNSSISLWRTHISNAEGYMALSAAFTFNADGTVPAGSTAQTAEHKATTMELYAVNNPRVTPAAAVLNRTYFEENIGSVTTANELVANTRMLNYIKTAFDLTGVTIVSSTIRNILTSDPDPNNPDSYINKFGGANKEKYIALRAAFNFQEDGTLADGQVPQTAAQTAATTRGYMNHYNDLDDAADDKAISLYKSQIGQVTTVREFLSEASVFDFALKAFGLDPSKVSALTIKNVLMSDLNDPKSYVYQLKDSRYVDLAKAFNFDTKGNIDAPALAQSESEILVMSKAYMLEKSRSGTADDKKAAEEEAKYYSSAIEKIETLDQLLENSRLVDFILEANRIDPEGVTPEFLRQIFTSDLDDPKSFINTQQERAWRSIVSSFNFNADGNIVVPDESIIQTRRGVYQTLDYYMRQALEENAGADNAGVRLALYFERMAHTVSSAYDILADDALYQVIKTSFGLPEEIGSADIDAQANLIKRYIDLADLQDPEKVSKLIVRFAVLYDAENNNTLDPALAVLTASGSTAGISADLMWSLAQLRTGGV